MEIQKKTSDDLREFLHMCITRLGQIEGKRYFSLMMSKLENDLLNELEKPLDMLLDVEGRFAAESDDRGDIEELPVVSDKEDYIPVLESL